MAQLTQALVGWLVIMGMVVGAVGVLFLVLGTLRALVALVRQGRRASAGALGLPGTSSR